MVKVISVNIKSDTMNVVFVAISLNLSTTFRLVNIIDINVFFLEIAEKTTFVLGKLPQILHS